VVLNRRTDLLPASQSRLRALDARHPGLIARLDALFGALANDLAVSATIRNEYGETIARGTVARYRRQWKAERRRELVAQAAAVARQELAREGRL
jgi:hypothetical protein